MISSGVCPLNRYSLRVISFFNRCDNIYRTIFDDGTPIHNGVMSVAELGYETDVLVSAAWVDELIDWTYEWTPISLSNLVTHGVMENRIHTLGDLPYRLVQ